MQQQQQRAVASSRVARSGPLRAPLVVRAAATSSPVAGQKFDYLIVGGGTAGCVLANRLSADGSKKVLMLEAGPSGDSLEIAVPAALTRLFKHPVLDWGLMSLTQKTVQSREVYLARGRALGGSSCTNATLYQRGAPSDYDSWGLDGWKGKDLVDWFMQAENYTDGPAPYHGMGGTMNVEKPRYQNILHEEFFKSCHAAGLAPNHDFNDWGRPQAGYGEFQVTQRKGERADMYRMYLKPSMGRENLKVLTGVRSTKLHFETSSSSSTPHATGVEFTSSSDAASPHFTAELAPGGEVLMCSGAIHTPHLLQLSGVGPAQSIQEHGIKVVADLPGVGANLQDHPATLYAARSDERFDSLSITSQVYDKKSNIRIPAALEYLFRRTGPFASTGCDHGAFVRTKAAKTEEADLQIRFVPGCALDADAIQSYVKFGELKKRGLAWPCGITMQLLAVRPASHGSVGLRSSDPLSAPAVDIGYFTDEGAGDLATLREGIRVARQIAESAPLSQYLTEEKYPGPQSSTDAELDDYIRRTACSGNALVGTCKMGRASDRTAVVDPASLKVHGIHGLRVIDASVMPRIPGGQTGAPTVMIAERAAALLTGKATIHSGTSLSPSGGRQLVGAA